MNLASIATFAEREYPDACIAPSTDGDGTPHLEIVWHHGRCLFMDGMYASVLRGGDMRCGEGPYDFERELRWVHSHGASETGGAS